VLPASTGSAVPASAGGAVPASNGGAVPALTSGAASASTDPVAAFLEGAGLPADTLAGIDPDTALREIGQMVRAAVEGVRDIMSTRALVKSEFRVDQTVLRRADNNQVKFAPDTQRCLAAMVGAAPPGFLPGPAAMQQSMDDIKLHELALVAALNSVFADMGQQLDPDAIMRRARQETGLSAMMPYAREAKCWAIYMENYKLLQESGAANTGGSLLAPLAQAYARQLKRGR
jgi:type VI secretion system FHA domain protein